MRRPLFWVCLFLSLTAALRFWLTGGFDPRGGASKPPDGKERAVLTGTVCGKETGRQKNDFLIEVDFSAAYPDAASSQQILHYLHQTHTKKLRCYLKAEACETMPEIGSKVRIAGCFSGYESATNAGEFDFEKYYRSDSIGGRFTDVEILQKSESYSRIREALWKLRRLMQRRLEDIFDEREAGVLKTMLLGDRSDLESELKDLYREGGILHILSISGLHITLIGMGAYRILRRIRIPDPLAALLSGAFLVLYGILTGMSISARRAIGMFLLRMLALLFGRTYDLLTALSVLGAGMLCMEPEYLLHSGFWLSFGSLYGIGCILPVLEQIAVQEPVRLQEQSRICDLYRAIASGIRGGAAVLLATLPLQLYFYFEIPVYSVIVNLLVLPCMGMIVCCGLLAAVTGLRIFATADTLLLKAIESLCRIVRKLPFFMWNPGAPKLWQIILYYACLAAALFALQRAERRRRTDRERGTPAGYRRVKIRESAGEREEWIRSRWYERLWERGWKCGACILPIVILALPTHRMCAAVFLDVGQGDAIILRLQNGQTWICDCGSTSKKQVGENILIPYLKHEGIHDVQGVFISHDDQDHISGLQELFAAAANGEIQIRRVIFSETLSEASESGRTECLREVFALEKQGLLETVSVGAGDGISGKNISFLVLNPKRERQDQTTKQTGQNKNASSLCLLVCMKQKDAAMRVLLTGDAEEDGERGMIEELDRRGIQFVDVLKCAHHGSRNATSQEFLNLLDLRLTVISCGRKNTYGHPHRELLERLEKDGGEILRTDESGAVTVCLRDGKVKALEW